MNLISKLSDHDLLNNTKILVIEEKRITQEVLNHLEEIEYRKLYLARGFPSLLDYCVVELKYSETSAKRRISAMWLIKTIPQAKEKLESGLVNLSTLTQLNGFLRREEKVKTYTHEMKLELLEKIEGKSQDQCEREFIRISPIEVSFKEKQRPLTEEFTQITFVASNELKAKLDILKNLTAHRNSTKSMAELIEIMADIALKKLNPIKSENEKNESIDGAPERIKSNPKIEETKFLKHGSSKNRIENNTNANYNAGKSAKNIMNNFENIGEKIAENTNENNAQGNIENEQKVFNSGSAAVLHRPKKYSSDSRYIPAAIKQYVWKRDQGCCQYTDKETHKKCESKLALQIDHVHPFSLGGQTSEENLRLLCRAHNNWRTRGLYNHVLMT